MNPILYDIMISPLDDHQWKIIGLITLICFGCAVAVVVIDAIVKVTKHDKQD